ncbi:MAG TPA: choice-of-anchor tandem repeat GloVer-containing protein, partial [Tepidisphaeraceae bacterium]|nr:choice-of-anchor tandem repeat GloVer-containing protein [Tepidisphaeraceae bacterium]
GLAERGASGGAGTLFKIGTDGSGFTVLHTFVDTSPNGAYPSGDLLQIGQSFYGMTSGGGDYHEGTIFRIGLDGTAFQLLHSFTFLPAQPTSGSNPSGSLISSGDVLYGMAGSSGNCAGTLFQMNTDGSGFTNLHVFGRDPTDGADPRGTPALSGSILYGMVQHGGTDPVTVSDGVIFSYSLPEPTPLAPLLAGGSILLVCRRRKLS